jgi:hypothetical protein
LGRLLSRRSAARRIHAHDRQKIARPKAAETGNLLWVGEGAMAKVHTKNLK